MKRAGAALLAICALVALSSLASRGWWALPMSMLVGGWLVVWHRFLVQRVSPGAIMAVGVALRVAWVLLVPTTPAVDFASYHQFAVGLATGTSTHLLYVTVPLQEIGYPLFLGGVYSLLGATAAVGRAVNVLLAFWLLVVVRRLLAPQGEVVTRTGLMLVSLWPAHIAMSSLLASENLFLPMLWSGALLTSSSTFVGGAMLGAAQAVRPVALMMMVVIGASHRRDWLKVGAVLVGAGLTFGAYRLVRVAAGDRAERGGVAYSLLMGTNRGSAGAWNFGDHQWFDRQRFEHGFGAASQEALSKALARISAEPLEMVALAARKFLTQWGDGAVAVTFAMPAPRAPWLALADAWAVALWLLALWRVRASSELVPLERLALVALGGTVASHLLLEANPRYALPWVVGVVLVAAGAAPRLTRTP